MWSVCRHTKSHRHQKVWAGLYNESVGWFIHGSSLSITFKMCSKSLQLKSSSRKYYNSSICILFCRHPPSRSSVFLVDFWGSCPLSSAVLNGMCRRQIVHSPITHVLVYFIIMYGIINETAIKMLILSHIYNIFCEFLFVSLFRSILNRQFHAQKKEKQKKNTWEKEEYRQMISFCRFGRLVGQTKSSYT